MSTLGPWTQAVDDIALRLTRVTGAAARHHLGRQHEFSHSLRSAAHTLRDSDTAQFDTRSFAFPGARGAIPPSGRFGRYEPSPLELHVRTRRLSIDDRLTRALPSSANGVYVTRDTDGFLYIYKPFRDEIYGDYNWLPHEDGQLAIREVAGYRVFELIDAPRVPPTALVDGPHGPGMAQLYIPLKRGKRADRFPEIQRAHTALGHFLIGNADGREGNHRPAHDGDPAHHPDDDLIVYDLGYSFPESADPLRGGDGMGEDFAFVSPFIRAWDGEKLPQSVLDSVDTLTPGRMGSALQDLRLSDSAIDGALDRLEYVRRERMVHG
ncbi:hypothetical protein [Nocardia sp. NBC_00416]|uniref:hypothetical protein n=1 Tax=Nocardia sp. NBC_00416 TaxID=2975991 RepID=UPI002E24F867